MPLAAAALPPRVSLPFDLLLLVHWQESLHKCTGIHASVLCEPAEVAVAHWEKHEEFGDTWGPLIASLQPDRDVVLFPGPDSFPADQFAWTGSIGSCKRRLVVLEASWAHGKTMYNFLVRYRQSLGLAPIPCVSLQVCGYLFHSFLSRQSNSPIRNTKNHHQGVVGKYWRFHEEGNSAVSTIEAIAHSAQAAGEKFSEVFPLFF